MKSLNQITNKINELPPEGKGLARCFGVSRVNRRETRFGFKNQLRLEFELDPKTFGVCSDWHPHRVFSRWFSYGLPAKLDSPKSNLTKFMEKWGDREMTWSEMYELILSGLSCLIGCTATVDICHKGGRKGPYATISSIAPGGENSLKLPTCEVGVASTVFGPDCDWDLIK